MRIVNAFFAHLCVLVGAPTGTRTLTSFLTTDLKSDVSANSTIGAYDRVYVSPRTAHPASLGLSFPTSAFPFVLGCTHPQMVHLVFWVGHWGWRSFALCPRWYAGWDSNPQAELPTVFETVLCAIRVPAHIECRFIHPTCCNKYGI